MEIRNCFSCWKSLFDGSSYLSNFWLDLCVLEDDEGYVALKEDNGFKYELMWLEEMGYIVTRETKEIVQVKICGRKVGSDHISYCVHEENDGKV